MEDGKAPQFAGPIPFTIFHFPWAAGDSGWFGVDETRLEETDSLARKDAENEASSVDSRFDLACSAAHALCLATSRLIHRSTRFGTGRWLVLNPGSFGFTGAVLPESSDL